MWRHVTMVTKFIDLNNRVFSLTWPASVQIYGNKRKSLHKKRVQLPEDWFATPTWPPFYCFEHRYGRPDVIWKRSVESLCNGDGEQQKSNRFRLAKEQLCTFITLLSAFLSLCCTTATWNVLISQKFSFSFSKLRYGLFGFAHNEIK